MVLSAPSRTTAGPRAPLAPRCASRRPAAAPRRAPVARAANSLEGRLSVDLVNGAVPNGPDLSCTVNGILFPNPFVIGSGPPGTNYAVMKRAFEDGWGGVIAKTISLDASKVNNVTPRYAKLKGADGSVLGWENIELISDRPFETMCKEMARLKKEFPDRVLIASVMEEYSKEAWVELIEKTVATGVDAIEINFSCPHGMPERRMGMAMGQDPDLLGEVCSWVREVCPIPFWAKMTPNVTDITVPAAAALDNGAAGIAAINTINSVTGINLDTLCPEPSVEGHSTQGGYSYKAVKPIALAKVMQIAKTIDARYKGTGATLSGLGGVDSGYDAAEFILAGSDTVQVCTGVMLHGYGHVKVLAAELQDFMARKGFNSIDEYRGVAVPKLTTHSELVRLQKEAQAKRKAKRVGLAKDDEWTGDAFVKQSESMVAN